MPELPEVHKFAQTIQEVSHDIFNRILLPSRSSNKWPPINCSGGFRLSATARGKELLLTLSPTVGPVQTFVFNHGLEGRWIWVPNASPIGSVTDKPTLLSFCSSNGVLSLVDKMCIASWHSGGFDPISRGPDPLTEPAEFVLRIQSDAPKEKEFAKQIGEVLLNQKYFNGIGNYLRAEVLARACVSPHTEARALFTDPRYKEKSELVLALCNAISREVVADRDLDKYGDHAQKRKFEAWLTCYGKALSEKDKGGRTMWYFADQDTRQPTQKDLNYSLDFRAKLNQSSASTTPLFSLAHGSPLAQVPAAGSFGRPVRPSATLATAPGQYPTMTKLLLLVSIVSKAGKINEAEKSSLKEIVVAGGSRKRAVWRAKLDSCLEYFEAENDVDELAETLRILVKHYSIATRNY